MIEIIFIWSLLFFLSISKKSGRLNIINLTFLSKVMIRFITVPFRPGTITYSMNKNDINGAIQSTPVISCIFLFFPAGQNLSNCFHAIWSKRKSHVISAKFKIWWNLLLHWNLLFQVSNVNFLWIFYSSFIFLRISW